MATWNHKRTCNCHVCQVITNWKVAAKFLEEMAAREEQQKDEPCLLCGKGKRIVGKYCSEAHRAMMHVFS